MINTEGIQLIKSFEACKLKAYLDSKKIPTIGWGNTFYENGTKVKLGDTITQERADRLFLNILAIFEKGVDQLITSNVNENQRSALISFAYNVGLDIDADTKVEGLGDSTLLKKVNANPGDLTIKNEFLKWVNKGSSFEKGLTRRRLGEWNLYNKK